MNDFEIGYISIWQVLEGRRHTIDIAGNLVSIAKSGEPPAIAFQAFHDNRLTLTVRTKDSGEEPVGRLSFIAESIRSPRCDAQIVPVCSLNVTISGEIYSGRGTRGFGMNESSSSSVLATSRQGKLREEVGEV